MDIDRHYMKFYHKFIDEINWVFEWQDFSLLLVLTKQQYVPQIIQSLNVRLHGK